ncbi:AprI/Inh family metalloprotease inhibitor [Microvirga flavescens]|uniref:AprI/Inh family metalloprotease inhibitor n=1 Tax=Microvirga flavescens TaxID=2249811 RepID=UPI001FE11EC6|nr:AprI/Inh family metalloprotease inhibitor [Microvirga flavescens]
MTRSISMMGVTLCAALALGACSSSRFGGGPIRAAAAPAPVEAVPSGPVETAPLPPIESQPLSPAAGAPIMTPAPATPGAPSEIASLPPQASAPAAPASRTSLVGAWTAREAAGTCKVQLSSSPSLDLYRASTSGCSNQDLSKVNAWDYRDGEIYLYQTGGAVAARLRGSSSALSGALTKSGAPLSLSR